MTPQFDFDHFNRPQIVVIPKIWTMWFTNHTVHIICGCTFAVRCCWCSFHIKQKYWIQIELIWNYFLEITCKQQTRFNLDIRRSDQIPSWERPRIPSSTWPSTFIDILYFFCKILKIWTCFVLLFFKWQKFCENEVGRAGRAIRRNEGLHARRWTIKNLCSKTKFSIDLDEFGIKFLTIAQPGLLQGTASYCRGA